MIAPVQLPFSSHSLLLSKNYEEAVATLNHKLSEPRTVKPVSCQGQANIHFTFQSLPKLKFFGAFWGNDPIEVSSEPLASWHGILPLTGGITNLHNSQQARAGELLLFAPGREIDVVWKEETKAIVIALDEQFLNGHIENNYSLQTPQINERSFYFNQQHPALTSLNSLLNVVNTELRLDGPLFNSVIAQQNLQSLFCENILQLIPALNTLPERPILPGALKRAVDYIHANLEQPWSIDELVSISGVSRRSLEQAFRQRLQTSPHKYLQSCRLNAAREYLKQSSPDRVQLADLAYRFGFAQPSHFAAAYKSQFGELPSQTLGNK